MSLTAAGLPAIASAPPREFDGPGDRWSPEDLLCASVADCFILTFRALARAAKLPWLHLNCRVEGTLERVDGITKFTRFATYAELKVSPGTDVERSKLLLDKAEHGCLIANSLTATRSLEAQVISP